MPKESPVSEAVPSPPHVHAPSSQEKPHWWERADRLRQALLTWPDVRQLTIFGRHGYYVRNCFFASLPLAEATLDVWLKIPDAQRQKYERHALALPAPHGMPGWTRLEIKEEAHVALALEALQCAYEAACSQAAKSGTSEVGVPVELVPEAPGKTHRKIPGGPRSGRFQTGLDVPGAYPQGATKARPQ